MWEKADAPRRVCFFQSKQGDQAGIGTAKERKKKTKEKNYAEIAKWLKMKHNFHFCVLLNVVECDKIDSRHKL